MVFPQFTNLQVEAWLHASRLGSSEQALCLFRANALNAEPIRQALLMLGSSEQPARISLQFAANSRTHEIRRLRLELVDPTDHLRVMNITAEADEASIRLTLLGLDLLTRAVNSWLDGVEDFGVSPRNSRLPRKELGLLDRSSLELWFWGPTYHGP